SKAEKQESTNSKKLANRKAGSKNTKPQLGVTTVIQYSSNLDQHMGAPQIERRLHVEKTRNIKVITKLESISSKDTYECLKGIISQVTCLGVNGSCMRKVVDIQIKYRG
ncbi:16195_t:CDS:1, partial [Dentiscutata erythropus]